MSVLRCGWLSLGLRHWDALPTFRVGLFSSQTPSQICPECVFSVMVIPIQTPSHWITFPGIEWGAGPEGSPPSSEQSGQPALQALSLLTRVALAWPAALDRGFQQSHGKSHLPVPGCRELYHSLVSLLHISRL